MRPAVINGKSIHSMLYDLCCSDTMPTYIDLSRGVVDNRDSDVEEVTSKVNGKCKYLVGETIR